MILPRCVLFCFTLVWLSTGWTPARSEEQPPNVLFIIADDLSAEALGCYGNSECKTPNIDRLAERATRFERAYCQYPVCAPSRAAMMGGMYPQETGVVGNGSASRFAEVMGKRPSMTQHFKNHDYHTARVSKIYHMRVPGDITAGVDGPDHKESWTERHNCQAPEWMTEGERIHLSKEKLRFDPDRHYGLGFGSAFYVVKGSGDGSEQADAIAAEKAVTILRERKAAARPFFLAVGLVRPHVPLVAPKPYFENYQPASLTIPDVPPNDQADIPRAGISRTTKTFGLTGKKADALAAYYASVEFMDAQVGRILAELERLELDRNTIVVFTSDHGWHLGEHDFWQKMSLHEESTRIPVLLRVPDAQRESRLNRKSFPRTTKALAQQIDFYPTLAALCGLSIPEHVRGKSWLPLLIDSDASVHKGVYSFHGRGHLWRTNNHAYIRYRDGSEELYDMRNDPNQFRNLIGTPSAEPIRADLASQLDRFLTTLPAQSPKKR